MADNHQIYWKIEIDPLPNGHIPSALFETEELAHEVGQKIRNKPYQITEIKADPAYTWTKCSVNGWFLTNSDQTINVWDRVTDGIIRRFIFVSIKSKFDQG